MSEISPAPSPKKEIIAPRQESIADEFAEDPPAAEPNYGEARLWLVARDPHCLFAYWDFRPSEHPVATGADGCVHFSLRIYREDGAVESTLEIQPGTGHQFVAAQVSDGGYFAELGFFAGDIWCFLVRSGKTRTPSELPDADHPVLFATIPAGASLDDIRQVLSRSALPGENLAVTAARLQAVARQNVGWTSKQERILSKILGEEMAGMGSAPSSLTLVERIRYKLAVAAKAAAPMPPVPAPQPESAPSSAGVSWPTSPAGTARS